MNSWQIFKTYVLTNPNAWSVSLVDTFVYIMRFGMLSWIPLYLLNVKHFTHDQMAFAFFIFEWAAIPSTLLSGWISDTLFKGRRMPLAIISCVIIFICIFIYWKSNSLIIVTTAAAIVGSLVYIPLFLASVQTMQVVPPFAVGSCVGLRGFMSYVFGTTIGTAVLGKAVDIWGWEAGFYILLTSAVLCIIMCTITHIGAIKIEKEAQKIQQTMNFNL